MRIAEGVSDLPSRRRRRRRAASEASRGLSRSAIVVVPSASRLISSLRDLGYEFTQSVADLVDNSIAAGAGRISIDLEFDGDNSWLRIADDGHGMDGRRLTEAMRYGAERTYGDEDLGKFGLGLKTASLSQCRRVTVISRFSTRQPEARCLDLDHVEDVDRWEILSIPPAAVSTKHTAVIGKRSGTVVLWEHLDRLLGYKVRDGGHARNGAEAMRTQLAQHLAMVFHRFLSGEIDGAKPLEISVNGTLLEPWDPFGLSEPATVTLPPRDFLLETNGRHGVVRFQPYVLPPKSHLSNEAAFETLSGPARWNAQQGFYVYRANRMIQSGGWNRLRALDEHLKLARASIDFFPELDSAFGVNVAKARVLLPVVLKEQLRAPLEELVSRAQAAYRSAGEASTGPRSKNTRNGKPAMLEPRVIRRALESSARTRGDLQALRRIASIVRKRHPRVADLIGW